MAFYHKLGKIPHKRHIVFRQENGELYEEQVVDLLFLPKRELVVLSMTVEEGIKMVVSGGIVTPPDRRPEHERGIVKVAAADGDKKTIIVQSTDWPGTNQTAKQKEPVE